MIELGRMAPWIVLVAVLLMAAIVVYVVYLLRRSVVPEGAFGTAAPPPGPDPTPAAGPIADPDVGEGSTADRTSGLRSAFRRGVARLKRQSGGAGVYSTPWALALGAPGAVEAELFDSAASTRLEGSHLDLQRGESRLNFCFFERGVLLDLGGDAITGSSRGLRTVLRLLQTKRPRLPLEAVVVTVSCATLQSARDAGRDALDRHAEMIYRALSQVQTQLALQVPVYLLVTGCETLPSFGDFAAALPERLRDEMLGWSNPYEPETAYQSRWVGQAFEALIERLRSTRAEVFAVSGDQERNGGVLLFPSELSALAAPLRAFADRVFQPSAYADPLRLRGVWLTGRAPATGEALFLRDLLDSKVFVERGLTRPGARTLVARNRKVRWVQAAIAVLLLTLTVGTGLTYRGMATERRQLLPIVRQASADLDALRDERALGVPPTDRRARAENIIESLPRLAGSHKASFFLPASWIGGVDETIAQALRTAFRELVLDSFRERLDEKAQELAFRPRTSAVETDLRSVSQLPPMFPTDTAEFAGLAAFFEEAQRLDRHAVLYNQVIIDPKPQEVGELFQYLFDAPPPPSLATVGGRFPLLRRRSDTSPLADPVSLEPYRTRVEDRVDGLFDAFWRRATTGSRLDRALVQLADELDATSDLTLDASGDAEVFRRTLELIRWLDAALAGPEYEWAFRSQLQLSQGYDRLFAPVPTSAGSASTGSPSPRTELLLEPRFSAQLVARGETEHRRFRLRLASHRSSNTGTLLETESGAPLMQLSGEIQLFRTALESLLNESFFSEPAEDRRGLSPAPLGTRVRWDPLQLDRAVALYAPYQSFQSRSLQTFPPRLRAGVDDVARDHLSRQMIERLGLARSEQPLSSAFSPQLLEQELRDDLANLEASADSLEQLLASFESIRDIEAYSDLQELLLQQLTGMLERVDRLLQRSRLYRPKEGDFAWWQGRVPPAYEAFDAASADDLRIYLDVQRQRANVLAVTYAQPILGLLSRLALADDPAVRALSQRWQLLLESLSSYVAQQAGNPIVELERFVLGPMTRLRLESAMRRQARPATTTGTADPAANPSNGPSNGAAFGANGATTSGATGGATTTCASLRASRPPRGSDFFTERRRALRSGLLERCAALAGSEGLAGYEALRRLFTTRLAGRYPFAEGSGAFGPQAQPDDIRRLMREVDRISPLLADAPADLGLGEAGVAARRFLEELQAVRAFFAPWLDAAEPTPEPIFDVDVTFRVEREAEIRGNQIIDWTLAIDDAAVRAGDESSRLRWQPGDSITLDLRWAKDAPRVPLATPRDQRIEVVDRTVTLRYARTWSLLALLEERATPRSLFPELRDPQPHTLRFDLVTAPTPTDESRRRDRDRERNRDRDRDRERSKEPGDDAPSLLDDVETVRVFVRVQVLSPTDSSPLRMPYFPTNAPRLTAEDAP